MSINRLVALSTSAIVTVCVVIGLYIAGSPTEQRQKRLDNKRISDLRDIVNGIDAYRRRHGQMPPTLGDIVEARRFTRLPTDPANGIPYSYTILDGEKYELCAQFDQPSNDDMAEDFWSHTQGEQCYVLEANPKQ